MRRSAATDPARCVGPCITHASSSTTPSSFGKPPYPTESSLGSSSTTVTVATTASSVSPPLFKISIPLSSACSPFALEIMIGRLPCAGRAGGAGASAASGLAKSLLAPAAKLLARDAIKNFRRDHSSMRCLLKMRRKYTSGTVRLEVRVRATGPSGLRSERPFLLKKGCAPDFFATCGIRPETRFHCCRAALPEAVSSVSCCFLLPARHTPLPARFSVSSLPSPRNGAIFSCPCARARAAQDSPHSFCRSYTLSVPTPSAATFRQRSLPSLIPCPAREITSARLYNFRQPASRRRSEFLRGTQTLSEN